MPYISCELWVLEFEVDCAIAMQNIRLLFYYIVTLNNETVSQEKKGGLSSLFKRTASIDNLNDNEVSLTMN